MPSSKAVQRKYYLKNRDKIITKTKEHKKTYVALHKRDTKSYLRYLLGKAKLRKKHEFSITPEDLYELWDKQNGLCIYSKKPLNIETNHLQRASLDRIDSSRGYVKENIQLVTYAVNKMKQEFSEVDFLEFCFSITDAKRKSYSKSTEPSKTDPL